MAIEVRFVLTEKQCVGLSNLLKVRLAEALQEQWYSDRFRYVPKDKRAGIIIRSNPDIAAARKALAALEKREGK